LIRMKILVVPFAIDLPKDANVVRMLIYYIKIKCV
jgi:hypothetical protein